MASAFAAHVFLAYFVSLPTLWAMVRRGRSAHPEAFAWTLGATALFYVAFGVFREQFCVVMCPYGRLQSALLDDDALVIGYDEAPRRAAREGEGSGRAACVDCHRCVVVCPTGIDIRDGLQLDCIACTACIDACDDVVDRLGQPRGLIRYDSLRGLRGEAAHPPPADLDLQRAARCRHRRDHDCGHETRAVRGERPPSARCAIHAMLGGCATASSST